MSNQNKATLLSDEIWPMFTDSAGLGKGAVVATSTSASFLDLGTVKPPTLPGTADARVDNDNQNILGHYVSIQAEAADAYVNFGPTQASVTTTNAPLPTAVGSNVVQLCLFIPAGTTWQGLIPVGPLEASQTQGAQSMGRFMGYVTKAGTGFLRVYQSSR